MNISYESLDAVEKRILYTRLNRRYLNFEAVFSDETEQFVRPFSPCGGETVHIRLRAGANQDCTAYLHTHDGTDMNTYDMERVPGDAAFDFFSADIVLGKVSVSYFFELRYQGRSYYYNKRGIQASADPAYHFRLIPDFSVPDWARGALMYQIFVDRFCNGDPGNDPLNNEYLYLGKPARASQWNQDVPASDVCNFYGGDLRGIMDKMRYLKDLGVEALYINPVFVSPSSHKYDVQDYDHVDPHFGVLINDGGETLKFEKFNNRYATRYVNRVTDPANLEASDKLLAEMIALAHENGIKVILDGVFNHCGSFNKWMDKGGFYAVKSAEGKAQYPPGAYRDEKSPYKDFFLWYDRDWPNNDCYDGWWGNENHPKLNYETSNELYEYIMGIARKWVSPPFNADGWRLDVAADLGRSPAFNHRFWRDFRKTVKEANPQAVILAEHYGDPSPWLSGGEWDTIMNYDAFMEPLSWFLTGVNKHSEECKPHLLNDTLSFENAMRYHMSKLNVHSLQTAMNELSNHDHSRFLTRTNRTAGRLHSAGPRAAEQRVNKNVMMEAVVFQMTWPGAPTIYYGDEAGLTGWTDPDDRRPFPWGGEDPVLMELHRVMASLRKTYPVLRQGSVEFLHNGYGFLSYGRWDGGNTGVVVAINNNSSSVDVSLPVWKTGLTSGALTRLAAAYDGRVHRAPQRINIIDGMAHVIAPPESAVVMGWNTYSDFD